MDFESGNSWKWPLLKRTLVCVVLSSGLNSTALASEDIYSSLNPLFLQRFRADPDALLLEIKVIQSEGKDFLVYKQPAEAEDGITCRLTFTRHGVAKKLACGLIPVSAVTSPEAFIYSFLLLGRKGHWYEVVVDPATRRTVWLKENQSGSVAYSVQTFSKVWLSGDVVYSIRGDMNKFTHGDRGHIAAQLFTEPKGTAQRTTSCQEWGFTTNTNQGGLVTTGQRSGPWLEVECKRDKCFSKFDPTNDGNYPAKPSEASRKKPPCPRGWIRWHDKDGRVLFTVDDLGKYGE